MKTRSQRLSEEEFLQIREKEVLPVWPTLSEINLEEAITYHKRMPQERNCAFRLSQAKKNGETHIWPRAGVALVEDMISTAQSLQDAGVLCICFVTDSYTRELEFEKAQRGMEESLRQGRSMLNGFPIINAGLGSVRRVAESVNIPMSGRLSTQRDSRFGAEMMFAGGITHWAGGAIDAVFAHEKNLPIEVAITHHRYVDRLISYYQERGVSLIKAEAGHLTGTLIPPCIGVSVIILGVLLAAEQGVKYTSGHYSLCGNLFQDVAAIRVLDELTEEYFHKLGFEGMTYLGGCAQWMGQFPPDEVDALALISWGTVAAALGQATYVVSKTSDEAYGIPTIEANIKGIKATKKILEMLKGQRLDEGGEVQKETEIIKAEVRSIVDTTIELGEGDLGRGVVEAFKLGVIDVPFSPNKCNMGKVIPARDSSGAVRILEIGHLPFPKDLVSFHKAKIAERKRLEKRGSKDDFEMVIHDILKV